MNGAFDDDAQKRYYSIYGFDRLHVVAAAAASWFTS